MEDDTIKIICNSLYAIFALYLVVLTGRALNMEYSAHSIAIIHLCSLTFLATSLIGTVSIIPSTPIPVTRAVRYLFFSVTVPDVLWYASASLYVVALVLAFTTPRGPALHYPSERIYSEKTLMQLTSRYEDNVCGVTGAQFPFSL